MTRRADKDREEPLLFDLPLESPRDLQSSAREPERQERKRKSPEPPQRTTADLTFDEGDDVLPAVPRLEIVSSKGEAGEAEEALAGKGSLVGSRFAAGGADLLIHGAVLVAAVAGCVLLGVRPTLPDWPALGLFLLAFSFLYTVVPLAFWGYTPGMAWARLTTQSDDGEPLTFGQTAVRWLGGVLTAAFLGLPLLLFGKRSLSDRLSHSQTLALH
jgi:uncharacterized RDD family membrane protein YckC